MAKPSRVTLVIMPVGSTVWDETGRLVGRADLPLTDAGANRVDHLASTWMGPEPGVLPKLVYAGPEESTKTAAAAFAKAVGCKSKPLSGLDNVDLGLWEGALRDELQERCPTTLRSWRENPERVSPPDGESVGEAADRIAEALVRAVERSKSIHPCLGVVLRPMAAAALVCRLGREPWSSYWDLTKPETGVIEVDCDLSDLRRERISASA